MHKMSHYTFTKSLGAFQLAASMLDSGAGESVLSSLLRKFLRSLKPCGACGYKPHWISELYICGLLSQMQVLKGAVPNEGFKSFAPQEEAVCFDFPFDYGSW